MKKAALAVLFVSIAAIAVAYAGVLIQGSGASWTAWTVAMATPFAMVATMTLGAARAGRSNGGLGMLALPFAVVLILMLGAFTLAFVLPAAAEPLLFGLPRRAAFVLYGVGLVPVLILPLAYALTFDEGTLTEEDIERVREAARMANTEP